MLKLKKDHPCICFIQAVFERCIRLGVYEDLVVDIPAELGPLIPAEPSFQFKYSSDAECELGKCLAPLVLSLLPPSPSPIPFLLPPPSLSAAAPIPEAQVATKLIESIKAKEKEQKMSEIIDSLQSVIPELSLDRNSNKKIVCLNQRKDFVSPPEFLYAKVSLVTQCILYAGHKTISHSFLALTK